MPRLLSEYFAARAQSAGRNCPNAVVEMAMRKETATTASALIVWKTTVALVIGSGLEDNKRFTNVKGYASQVLAKTSRFRGLQRRERLFSARFVGYPEFAARRVIGTSPWSVTLAHLHHRCRLQIALPADGAYAILRRLAIHLKRADRSDREKIASFHKEEDDRELPRVRQFSRGHAPSRFAALHRCSLT